MSRLRARSRWKSLDLASCFAFLAPNFVGFLAFTLFPLLACLALSFTRWNLAGRPTFIGFENFVSLLGFHREGERLAANDAQFYRYLWNTVYLMGGLPISIIFSLLFALLLNQRLRGVVFFRTLFFLPAVCSAVATALLWKWIFEPDFGLLNSFLRAAGVGAPPAWLADPAWAKPALIIMAVWMTAGGTNCVLYLAGLQGIPQEYYEAAELDGAGWWSKLRHITWPMLSPTTFFIVVMSVIAGFQGGFIAAFMMTDGGPAGATTTIMFYIYQRAFRWFEMGYASAVAVFLFALILGLTLLNWRIGQRLVHYG
jgi:multiple sugar transport system permease protein